MTDFARKHKTLENANMRISYREGLVGNKEIFENHCHTRYEMISVFEGKVGIVVDNRRYTLKEGEIAIIPPLVYHSVFSKDELMYKRATILFAVFSFVPFFTSNSYFSLHLRFISSSTCIVSVSLVSVFKRNNLFVSFDFRRTIFDISISKCSFNR